MSTQVRSIGHVLPLLAGPLIWAAHFFTVYLVEAFACDAVNAGFVRAVGAGTTFLALAAISCAGWVFWKSLPRKNGIGELFALPLAAVSGIAIAWTALPLALLPSCTPATG